jgi:predicted flap endonuclease-1-like 5' DNA nuclease
MAKIVAFRTLLENCMGLTAAAHDTIEGQGITTLAELADLDYDDIENMVMNILKFSAPHAAAGDIIRISDVAQK